MPPVRLAPRKPIMTEWHALKIKVLFKGFFVKIFDFYKYLFLRHLTNYEEVARYVRLIIVKKHLFLKIL